MNDHPDRNTDAVTITVLGSGTCVPSLTRGACSLLAAAIRLTRSVVNEMR